MIDKPMTTEEFYRLVFVYRLEVRFARQRYDREAQALRQLKMTYGGRVPQAIWEKQRRRTLGAYTRLGVRRAMLHTLLEALNN
jgi:hypothetical protein